MVVSFGIRSCFAVELAHCQEEYLVCRCWQGRSHLRSRLILFKRLQHTMSALHVNLIRRIYTLKNIPNADTMTKSIPYCGFGLYYYD